MKNLLNQVNVYICDFDETVVKAYLNDNEIVYSYGLELTNSPLGWADEYSPCAVSANSDNLWNAIVKEFKAEIENLYQTYVGKDYNPDYVSFADFLVDDTSIEAIKIREFIKNYKNNFYEEQANLAVDCRPNSNFIDCKYISSSSYGTHSDILVAYTVFQVLAKNYAEFLQNKTAEEIKDEVYSLSYDFKTAYEEKTEDLDLDELDYFDELDFLEKWLAEEITEE